MESLGLIKKQLVTIKRLKEVGIREYDKDSDLNYLPNIKICQRLHIVNVKY